MSTRRLILAAALVVVLMVAAAFVPIRPFLLWAVDWSSRAGPVAMVAYVVLFVAMTTLLLPAASVLIGLAGFSFGFIPALLLTLLANAIACWMQWILGAGPLRRWVLGRERFGPALELVDETVQRDAFQVVLLARFSPIVPFGVLNMACGAARVPVRPYVFASIIGLAPAAVAFTFLGALAEEATQVLAGAVSTEARVVQVVGLCLGVVSTILLLWWTGRLTRAALERKRDNTGGEDRSARVVSG